MKMSATRKAVLTILIISTVLFALIQFSPIGMAIYVTYAAFVIGLTVIFPWQTFMKDKTWKWWVIAPVAFPLLVAPVVEEIWISYLFEKACKDAGVHVKQKVVVEGYYNSTTTGWSEPETILEQSLIDRYEEAGFLFQERVAKHNKVSHVEKGVDGKWRVSIRDEPQSRYHLRRTYPRHGHIVDYRLKKFEKDVYDSLKKEVIARDTSYARYPGIIEMQWIRFFGDGQQLCKGPLDEPEKHRRVPTFIKQVLVPKL